MVIQSKYGQVEWTGQMDGTEDSLIYYVPIYYVLC